MSTDADASLDDPAGPPGGHGPGVNTTLKFKLEACQRVQHWHWHADSEIDPWSRTANWCGRGPWHLTGTSRLARPRPTSGPTRTAPALVARTQWHLPLAGASATPRPAAAGPPPAAPGRGGPA
jgi:hypothetical protein